MSVQDIVFWVQIGLNALIALGFSMCYFYQVIYTFAVLFKKIPPHKEEVIHTLAVLISARNEEAVIGKLIDSVRSQDYPQEKITVFVCADNCTDGTARVAAEHGAEVFVRNNTEKIGKGYALDELLGYIGGVYPDDPFDAYIVFDADNILAPRFIREINRTFSDGYDIVTGFRNSKNYGDSWISAGTGLWFVHDSEFLNGARMRLGICCDIKGTGFLFSREVMKEQGGWPFHMLTEDVEFSAYHGVRGAKIGYNPDAEFFDEQVAGWRASFRQRMRWCKGGIQVFRAYGKRLGRGIFRRRTHKTCWDMVMMIAPAATCATVFLIVNAAFLVANAALGMSVLPTLVILLIGFLLIYGIIFMMGLFATIKDWKRIYASPVKKVLYCFTLPIFMMTYLPIAVAAAFAKVEWTPVVHTKAETLGEVLEKRERE